MKSYPQQPKISVESALKFMALQATGMVIAPLSVPGVDLAPGHHFHDTWECFLPRGAPLRFEVAGGGGLTVPDGTCLLVPPGCVHLAIDKVRQSNDLVFLVMSLPGSNVPHGAVSCGTRAGGREWVVLSAEGAAAWSALLGGEPDAMIGRAAAALANGGWGSERGAALVRLVACAFGEAAAGMRQERVERRGEPRIRQADRLLRERFYDPTLSLASVAREVGLSATHLATRFKMLTGRTFWKTIMDIRLARARALLEAGRHSVKEVAALTGWSNPLYFSAAYRRHYGIPPSATRP